MKKTVLLTSATILLGVGFQAINASAAETFPKEYNTEGTITFEAGDNEITPPVDPENPDPTDPVDPIDPPGRERVVPYQLIMGQNLNLAHKRFLRQIKRIMLRQMK